MRCKDIRICQMNISTLVLCRQDVNYAQNFIQNSFWILKTIGQIYNELQFWWCRLRNNLRQKKNRKKVAYGWVLGYGFDITKTVANMDIFSLLNMNVHYIAPQKVYIKGCPKSPTQWVWICVAKYSDFMHHFIRNSFLFTLSIFIDDNLALLYFYVMSNVCESTY